MVRRNTYVTGDSDLKVLTLFWSLLLCVVQHRVIGMCNVHVVWDLLGFDSNFSLAIRNSCRIKGFVVGTTVYPVKCSDRSDPEAASPVYQVEPVWSKGKNKKQTTTKKPNSKQQWPVANAGQGGFLRLHTEASSSCSA